MSAARTVFAERGFNAPLNLIARTAGVGQGSLYRHFPTRESLALAVFEDNIAELERISAAPDATLEQVLAAVVAQLTDSIGLVAIVDPMTDDARLVSQNARMTVLFGDRLAAARATGAVRSDITVGDLLLTLGMYSGILARTDPARRPAVGARAWELLRRSLFES
ncbi:TetR family transcriptional regulator [Nocardia goodfellowii]